jgi:hypothetical protein
MAHRHTRPGTRRIGSNGLLLGALLAATLARAGDLNGKVPLDIPQQNLSSALTALAKQADLQILFSQELVAGQRSNAVTGSLSGAEALQRLLADSTLEYVVNGADTVVIRQRQNVQGCQPPPPYLASFTWHPSIFSPKTRIPNLPPALHPHF